MDRFTPWTPPGPHLTNSLQTPRYLSPGTTITARRPYRRRAACDLGSDHRLHRRWRLGHVEVELHHPVKARQGVPHTDAHCELDELSRIEQFFRLVAKLCR